MTQVPRTISREKIQASTRSRTCYAPWLVACIMPIIGHIWCWCSPCLYVWYVLKPTESNTRRRPAHIHCFDDDNNNEIRIRRHNCYSVVLIYVTHISCLLRICIDFVILSESEVISCHYLEQQNAMFCKLYPIFSVTSNLFYKLCFCRFDLNQIHLMRTHYI